MKISLVIIFFVFYSISAFSEHTGLGGRPMINSISPDDISEILLKDGTVIKLDNLKINPSENKIDEIFIINSSEDQNQ